MGDVLSTVWKRFSGSGTRAISPGAHVVRIGAGCTVEGRVEADTVIVEGGTLIVRTLRCARLVITGGTVSADCIVVQSLSIDGESQVSIQDLRAGAAVTAGLRSLASA